MRSIVRPFIWVVLGIFSVLLPKLVSPEIIEHAYSRGLFLSIRRGLDSFTQFMPFPTIYLLALVLLVLLFLFVRSIVNWRKRKWWKPVISLLNFCGASVFFFQLLWGWNYGRLPIESHLELKTAPLNSTELTEELEWATQQVITYHTRNLKEFPPLSKYYDDGESIVRHSLESTLHQLDYPTDGAVRARVLQPKGILMRWSASGIYIPYVGEGHLDDGLHELRVPFVMAHEMAHGYGFADEGTCNFLAYLACTNSTDEYIQYAGHLMYWRYVAREYYKTHLISYDELLSQLPAKAQNDLEAIQKESAKYPDYFPKLGKATYDKYLQAQGVKEGMESYNKIVMMVKAWRENKEVPTSGGHN